MTRARSALRFAREDTFAGDALNAAGVVVAASTTEPASSAGGDVAGSASTESRREAAAAASARSARVSAGDLGSIDARSVTAAEGDTEAFRVTLQSSNALAAGLGFSAVIVISERSVARFARSPSARRPDAGVAAALFTARVGGVRPAFSSMLFSAEKSTAANADSESARSRAGNASPFATSPFVPEEGDFFAACPSRRDESVAARRDPGVAPTLATRVAALDRPGIAASSRGARCADGRASRVVNHDKIVRLNGSERFFEPFIWQLSGIGRRRYQPD
jgi:hypothetical protein